MIEIVRMTESDVPQIAQVEKRCFREGWSEKSFYDEMSNSLAYYLVAKDGDSCVGYAGFWNVSGEGGITNVAVIPEYRQKGVGSKLIEGLIERGRELRLDLLTLEVRKSNTVAQHLYKKFGFEILGERKRYYNDNGEDAYIMTKTFHRGEDKNAYFGN